MHCIFELHQSNEVAAAHRSTSSRRIGSSSIDATHSLRETVMKHVQQRFLCMHSILCLVKDDALRAVDHFSSLLEPACCRQTVHKNRVRIRQFHHSAIDLIRHKDLLPHIGLLVRDSIRHPGVAVDYIRALRSLLDVSGDRNITPQSLTLCDDFLFHFITLSFIHGTANSHLHSQNASESHQIVRHIIRDVAEKCQFQALGIAFFLHDC
mmetsp:Transcript_12719/g.23075  ORF Transcript_12719/g.23075 Transcript_12719/m.23075 type:complete len:209 (+) Transcript_12719:116-742(+)